MKTRFLLSTTCLCAGLVPALAALFLTGAQVAAPAPAPASAVILPGEAGAAIKFEHGEILTGKHPELWIASVRASVYSRGHEPYLTIDGKADTEWRVTGPPPAPMRRGNWLEIELNKPATVGSIEVDWIGTAPYNYIVYKKPRDDFRDSVREGRSAGGEGGLEKIDLPPDVVTRVIRVEFATAEGNPVQGIREIRIGGVAYPAGYPRAADKFAPIETVRRVLYVEFERMPFVNVFNPKLPYADGGSGLRLLPRDDAFEGGHADFTAPVTPDKDNWITLKLWECRDASMTQRGDLIALETRDGDATQRGRAYMPALVTEQQHTEQTWYGPEPQPGRWSYAHYKIPAEVIGQRSAIPLRLQGIGNVRRDYPMRTPSPTIYSITSATVPAL